MATIIERDVSRSGDGDSAMTMIVAILAIVVIVGMALYAFRLFPFADNTPATNNGGGSINIDVDPPAQQ